MKKWISAAATAAGAYLIAIAPRLCERPERMPKVYYAHRGLYDNISDAPENSLAAFQKAVDAGYGIELDVQMTADAEVLRGFARLGNKPSVRLVRKEYEEGRKQI